MSGNQPYKQFIVFIITVLLITSMLSLFSILTIHATSFQLSDTDQNDGFYLSTTFDDINPSDRENCTVVDNNIVLDPQGSGVHTYDFSSWSSNSNDKAFSYNTPYFIYFYPLEAHIRLEDEIENDFAIDSIAEPDGVTYPLQTGEDASPLQRVHHFRFKITQNPDSLTKLGLHWRGKAENDRKVTFYYWQPFDVGNFGLWQSIGEKTSNNNYIEFWQNFTGDLFLNQQDYIDLCVVLTPEYGERCSLFTDYVSVVAHGIGYATDGWVQSPTISPQEIDRWERFSWHDLEPGQTSIRYYLYYENETGALHPVGTNYLPGNNNGFTTSPVNILQVPSNYNLSIRATLTTSNLSRTPSILSWGLTWQQEENGWRDSFNASLRLDSSLLDNIEMDTGMIQLQSSLYSWPMFGQNPMNTRVSDGLGPESDSNSLQWYSATNVGGLNRNPVVKDGRLYAASENGGQLFVYDALATTKLFSPNPILSSSNLPPESIQNTPLVTDSAVIVATGTSANGGGIQNKIYAFPHDLGSSPLWVFDYGQIYADNPGICYTASPIFSNGKIYITSWSGDSSIWNSLWNLINFSTGTNKLIVLDEQGNLDWQYTLPAGSFASPAVTDTTVVVGCEKRNGDSLLAFSTSGIVKWKKNVGAIGYAAPVINDDTIFVMTKKTTAIPFVAYSELVAVNLNNGNILWNVTIGDSIAESYQYAAYTTPAVADDAVFVISPDGILHAFDVETGVQLWQKTVYDKGMFSTEYLLTSPAYANDIIYVGTPAGDIYALDATTNETIWSQKTIDGSGVVSSPIIADGLIYYISEDGSINCRGNHRLPTGEQITGSCVSLPIHLPDEANYEWDRFYSEYLLQNGDIEFSILDDNQATVLIEDIEDGQSIATTAVTNRDAIRLKADFSKETNGEVSLLEWSVTFIESGEEDNETFFYENSFAKMGTPPNCSIDVRNENVGIRNDSAAYKLRYENDTGTHITDWIPTNCSGVNGSTQRETIWANTSELSYSEDVIWFLEIRFKIKNNNSEESFSKWFDIENPEYPDEANPRFIQNSFTPSSQWIATVTPTCTIRVQDRGTDGNTSGLDVTSATYTLTYEDDDGSHTDTFQASCSGSNGTTAIQTITADISDTPDSDSFTDVTEIFFSITDLAGNTNSSLDYSLTVDSEKPFSEISNADSIPSVTNQSPVLIQATANDSLSGINEVTLYYRLTSATQWSTFADDSIPPYEWNFTVGSNNGGEYELCTVAVDNASNEESFPSTPDVMLLFDPNPPSKPSFSSQYRFTTDEVPEFSDVTFSDDYELKQIYYRLSFEGTDEWTSVTENDLTTKTITPTWNLTSSQWEIMQEDITYYIYFRVIDLLGNTYITPSQSEAMQVIRDTDNQTPTPYDPDLSDFDTWQWNNEYTIRLTGSTSDLSSAQLWYRFSTDNTSWSNWAQFGENITSAPFSWTFDLPNGSGYYAFKTTIFTTQGLTQTSNEYIIEIIAFPFIELIVLSVLVILFIIVSIIYFQRKQRW